MGVVETMSSMVTSPGANVSVEILASVHKLLADLTNSSTSLQALHPHCDPLAIFASSQLSLQIPHCLRNPVRCT